MRRTLPSLAALTLACLLTACGGDSGTTVTASTTVTPSADAPTASAPAAIAPSTGTPAPAASTPTPVPTPPKPKPKLPAGPALTCKQLAGAQVGSAEARYNGYPDHLPLTEGVWNGEDGTTVTLQTPCGIGDLDGDGNADAVGVVALHAGGSGTFFTVLAWRNDGGEPAFQALAELGDRTPVLSIGVTAGQAKVVWLTRSEGKGLAELDIKRTSVYVLSGTKLVEASHTDAPYAP